MKPNDSIKSFIKCWCYNLSKTWCNGDKVFKYCYMFKWSEAYCDTRKAHLPKGFTQKSKVLPWLHGHIPLMHAPACYTMPSMHLRGYYSDLCPQFLHMHILLFCLTYMEHVYLVFTPQIFWNQLFSLWFLDQSSSNSLTVASSQIITKAQMILKLYSTVCCTRFHKIMLLFC